MYTKEDMLAQFLERAAQPHPMTKSLGFTDEMIADLRRQKEWWAAANPEYFQHQADRANAINAYNEALERGAEQAELDKLEQQAKDVAEASINRQK